MEYEERIRKADWILFLYLTLLKGDKVVKVSEIGGYFVLFRFAWHIYFEL